MEEILVDASNSTVAEIKSKYSFTNWLWFFTLYALVLISVLYLLNSPRWPSKNACVPPTQGEFTQMRRMLFSSMCAIVKVQMELEPDSTIFQAINNNKSLEVCELKRESSIHSLFITLTGDKSESTPFTLDDCHYRYQVEKCAVLFEHCDCNEDDEIVIGEMMSARTTCLPDCMALTKLYYYKWPF